MPAGNPACPLPESAGIGNRLDECLLAADSQLRLRHELAAVACAAEETMAQSTLQGKARNHTGRTPAHYCRRGEPRTEIVVSVVLAFRRKPGRHCQLEGRGRGLAEPYRQFHPPKTGVPVVVHLGKEALNLLKDLPAEGLFFSYLANVRAADRATEFRSRCRQLARLPRTRAALTPSGSVPDEVGTGSITVDTNTHTVWTAYHKGGECFVQPFAPGKWPIKNGFKFP